MKTRSFFLLFFIILLLSTATLAITDYSKVKGDFKVFCLGESWETTLKKIKYLESIKEILPGDMVLYEKDTAEFTTTMALKSRQKVRCSLHYYQNKLFWIASVFKEFQAEDYDTTQKNYLLNELLPAFRIRYGKPINLLKYPTQEELARGFHKTGGCWLAEWILNTKLVLVTIRSADGIPEINITDAVVMAKFDI